MRIDRELPETPETKPWAFESYQGIISEIVHVLELVFYQEFDLSSQGVFRGLRWAKTLGLVKNTGPRSRTIRITEAGLQWRKLFDESVNGCSKALR